MKKWIENIKFDGKRSCYRPHLLSDIMAFPSKKLAHKYAKENSIPTKFIERVGSRFQYAWGLMDDHGRFLAARWENGL